MIRRKYNIGIQMHGIGCFISNYFAGCHGYADDLLLLCPSRSGLQEMLDLSQNYVQTHKISFSTNPDPRKSKTKGIVFSKENLKFDPAQLVLNGDSLPWVTSAKYLGNTIESIPNGLAKDTKQKRAQYIEKNCELVQEFGFAHPDVKSRLNRIYNSSFPGSLLWDLSSENVKQIVNSWSVSARIMWGLPHDAHRYLIEELSGEHAFVMIVSRYIKFIQSIKKSPKYPVQFLLEKVMNNVNKLTLTFHSYLIK